MLTANSTQRGLLLLLASSILLGTGCVTNGRKVLLKEYSSDIPIQSSDALKGKTIYIKGFVSAPNLVSPDPSTEPTEPENFTYVPQTPAQDQQWATEMESLQKSVQEGNLKKIGKLRNGFGMVMSHVYALNDPSEWLRGSLKLDLEAHGAKVVDASQSAAADASISGTVQLCRTDMYFTVNGTLVVDVEIQIQGGRPVRKRFHTHGATAAMLASEGEHFHALRDARQKVSIFIIRELIAALRST